MADFNWHNECINPCIMHFEIADVFFTLSLWKCNDPFDLLYYGQYYIAVKAEFKGYGYRLINKEKCSFSIGDLPTDDVTSNLFQKQLKVLITKFFKDHPEFLEIYNKYSNKEKITYE